jgi:lipid-binding SYLF domain-containing protein
MKAIRTLSFAAGLATCLALPAGVLADATLKESEHAVTEIVAADAGQQKFLDNAAGYAVFPNVAKGGLVIGGAGGSGFVFEKGKAVGTAISRTRIRSQRSRRASGRWPRR